MRRYQFIVGVSLSALEAELNRVVNDEWSLELIQVFYAQGTGFVGVLERIEAVEVETEVEAVAERTQRKDEPAKPKANPRRSRKKSR